MKDGQDSGSPAIGFISAIIVAAISVMPSAMAKSPKFNKGDCIVRADESDLKPKYQTARYLIVDVTEKHYIVKPVDLVTWTYGEPYAQPTGPLDMLFIKTTGCPE